MKGGKKVKHIYELGILLYNTACGMHI